MRRILAAATAILAMAVGLSVTSASAAQMPVFAGLQTSFADASACAPANEGGVPVVKTTASSSGSASAVALSGIPAGCAGLSLEVFVHDTSGTIIASGAGTAAGTVSIGVGTYATASVATVIARIGGWIFPTEWTAPPPTTGPAATCQAINPGGQVRDTATCSVTLSPNGGPPWGHQGSQLWNFTFNVTWDTQPPNSNWTWRVTFDLAQSPFPGFTPQWVGTYSNSGMGLAPGYSCAQLPTLTMQSTSQNVWGGTLEISDGPAPGYFSGQSFCN